MNQTSNDRANRLASPDFSAHSPEETLRKPGVSSYAGDAARGRADCVPSFQAALNAFRQSISLLDA